MNWMPRLALAACFIVLADVLLRTESPGLGLALFALALGVVLALQYRTRLLRAGGWPALWLTLAAGAAWDVSISGKVLLVALGWAILAYATLPACDGLFTALLRGFSGGLRSLGAGVVDTRRVALLQERRLTRRNLRQMPWTVYAVPLALVTLFALLLVPANLALANWMYTGVQALLEFASGYNLERLTFWLGTGVAVYGVFRFRASRRVSRQSDAVPIQPADGGAELRSALLTFIGLNALYMLTNLSDALYLWLNFALPEGLSYSAYAHQGSYRLIAAVVLAAVTVTVFFRLHAPALKQGTARLLAYLFVAQNLLVLAGAGRRLWLYIEVYGLTRFRVATFLWMLLVAAGFVLILLKIAQRRPLAFLLRWNAVATVLLLSVVALADLDGQIANWNVGRFEAGHADAVDLRYLMELGPGAIPALRRLSNREDSMGRSAFEILAYSNMKEREIQNRWQNWTWRRRVLFSAQ